MKKIFGIILLLVMVVGIPNVSAARVTSFPSYALFDEETPSGEVTGGVSVSTSYCSNENFLKPFRLLGRVFSVIKILIPILVIAFGVIDFFKAVIASKDDEIKKATKSLILRAIAGVIIFFLPALIHFFFKLVDEWQNYENDYSKCSLCITEPNRC